MEERETQNALLDIAANLLLEIDLFGRILYANAAAERTFSQPHLLGRLLEDLLAPAAFRQLQEAIRDSMSGEHSNNLLLEIKKRYYMVFIRPSHTKVSLCLEDITDKIELSQQLEKLSRRLEFAERTTLLGYWELDLNSRKFYWSAEMYRIFGVDPKENRPQHNYIRDLIDPEDLPLYKEKLRELIQTFVPVEGLLRIRRPDKKLIYCFFKASLRSENNRRFIAGTFQDLTLLIETQLHLEQAVQRAEELSSAKSYFLAQASHDLRQPMQALKIFISALLDEKLSPEQQNLVNKIDESSSNLNNLLDNLLDISRIEAGGLSYHPSSFDLGSLISGLAREYRELAAGKNIDFRFIPFHCIIISDPILIERIIRNLLNNAFKYTKNKIILGVKRHKKSISILVADNGCGISHEEQSKIFGDFYQSRQCASRKKLGAGLGLAIVSRIAKLLSAQVDVCSIPGQGSCFSLELPYKKTPL